MCRGVLGFPRAATETILEVSQGCSIFQLRLGKRYSAEDNPADVQTWTAGQSSRSMAERGSRCDVLLVGIYEVVCQGGSVAAAGLQRV